MADDPIHDWAINLWEEGCKRRQGTEAQWWENIATYMGDFWAEFNIRDKKLWAPEAPDHRVRLPMNLAQPAVRTEYAKLLKNRPMVDCLARSADQSDLNSAEVGDKLLYNYVEKQLSMPRIRRRMLQWVLICGTGGIFADYDENALGEQDVLMGPDGNPVTDLRMISSIQRHYRDKRKAPKTTRIKQGELTHQPLSPWQFMFDFSKLDYTEASWVIVSFIMDVDEVVARWGIEPTAFERHSNPGILQRRMIEQWDLSGMMDHNTEATQKLCEVHRLFVKPGHRYFPQGAEIVFTKNECLDKTKYPYSFNMLPVGAMGHVPFPGSQYSLSVLSSIKPIVLELSKTMSQLIENRNLMANPAWIEYRQNRIKGEIQNKPGARIEVEWMPNVPEPHPVEMPEIPNYVQQLIPVIKETVLEIAGQSEVSQGKVPQGARAGVTIAYLQEEDDTKLGPTVQEYEECMERVAWLDLQIIAEKYDAPRTIRIFRKHSEPEVFDFIGTMLQGVAGVVCQAGSALPRSKAAKQQFILDLWDRQLEQDPRKVREMLELSQGEPDEWEIDINQAERENRKLAGGTPITVEEWHNHQAHQYQHRRYMKSAEFEGLDPQTQEAFRTHDKEHSRYLASQQQQQALSQQATTGGGQPKQPGGPQASGGGANGVTATPSGPFAPSPNGAAGPNVQDYAPQ
jgi:hypothetical protein